MTTSQPRRQWPLDSNTMHDMSVADALSPRHVVLLYCRHTECRLSLCNRVSAMLASNITSVSETSTTTAKTINVEVPEWIYWHVRRCATESQMSMKEFMAAFCQTAKPIVTAPAAANLPQ